MHEGRGGKEGSEEEGSTRREARRIDTHTDSAEGTAVRQPCRGSWSVGAECAAGSQGECLQHKGTDLSSTAAAVSHLVGLSLRPSSIPRISSLTCTHQHTQLTVWVGAHIYITWAQALDACTATAAASKHARHCQGRRRVAAAPAALHPRRQLSQSQVLQATITRNPRNTSRSWPRPPAHLLIVFTLCPAHLALCAQGILQVPVQLVNQLLWGRSRRGQG
jgi:hypothetical protein